MTFEFPNDIVKRALAQYAQDDVSTDDWQDALSALKQTDNGRRVTIATDTTAAKTLLKYCLRIENDKPQDRSR